MDVRGKWIALLQLMLSVLFLILLWGSGLAPLRYLAAAGVLLAILGGLLLACQYRGARLRLAGAAVSFLLSFALLVGMGYVDQAAYTVQKVGGAAYKTDNMVVVVKKEKPVSTLYDMANYRYGTQGAADRENTERMMEKIDEILERAVNRTEYAAVTELAEALLGGAVEAAVYNEAFTGVIEEAIPDYQSRIRVIYHYGIDTELERKDRSVDEPFHLYISGIDTSGPISVNSRSDVNIIATVNPGTRQILLTSTPRDYYVALPGVSGEQKDKLTHAGIYGVDVSAAALEALYGIEIPYYVKVNFTSLIEIVDLLGGIDVYSDVAFTSRHGGYAFAEGMNHMDGRQALGFVRERYSFRDGDYQRGKNQEKVLTALIQKALSPAVLGRAGELMEKMSGSLETNMPPERIVQLIQTQLDEGGDWEIQSVSAAGLGDRQTCYSSGDTVLYVVQPDQTSVEEVKRRMRAVLEAAG